MIQELSAVHDFGTWIQAWERTGREPFSHPRYVSLFARPADQVLALHWQSDSAEVLLPLIIRALPGELAGSSDGWRDVVSPYGYGGPYAAGVVDWSAFYTDLLNWMRAAKMVTAFLRGSLSTPFPSIPLTGYTPAHINDNVVVDVRRNPAEQWTHYDHKVRKNVRKAERAGLRVEIQADFRHLDAFLDVYHSTMQRREASAWYYFEKPFFQVFDDALRGSFVVVEVYDPEDTLVSTELVLESDRWLYSFLGGTRRDAFAYAPNDLLKHAVIEYGRGRGKDGYVLGGGYTTGDGIFRYKKSFDPEGVRPFHGIQLTAEPGVYADLTRRHQERAGQDVSMTSFFPAYRAPIQQVPCSTSTPPES